MTSPKMKQILRLFENPATSPDGKITKYFTIKVFSLWYHYNAEKYIGEILGRMVKNGLLARVSPGVFRRGEVVGKGPVKIKEAAEDKNQMNLF
ncbi:MAG: hypothetical protein WBN66_03655 [Smithella sp.]